MSIDNISLRVKLLFPLGLMALTIVAMVALGANRLYSVSASASDIIEKRQLAAADLSRAGRKIIQIPFAIDTAILHNANSEAGVAATVDIKDAPADARKLLASAAQAVPARAAEISRFSSRIDALAKRAQAVFDTVKDAQGLDAGKSLLPAEVATLAKAAQDSADIDADARALAGELTIYDDKLKKDNAAAAEGLDATSRSALIELSLIGVLCTALAGAFSYWMASAKTVGPLNRLGAQMRALAGGDLSTRIDGLERGDEIGQMAKAVDVFKTNAVARRDAEARVEAERKAVEAEKERASQSRAGATQAQAAAMSALSDGLKRLAEGDLLVRLDAGFSAEYAAVRDDFNSAASKLKAALSAVAQSASAIRSSSREIASASDNLSQRTEQQAASLEETAAALEEITTTLKTSAAGAQHAAEVVATADSDAKQGAVVVRQAVEAMDAIAESSKQIGQIIGVIDEIAFQTNLLALNAGVEAARAGDSGKGFAVVASEVRALAQRSAEAAKEIKSLVSTSGLQVENGVQLVADTGMALENIISQVSEINKVVADIAAGAQQQATGLQQINAAINQMDQSTQQNATMVEESNAASQTLSKETGELARLIEQFRVEDVAESRLRRDLKAAAPHAFAKPAAPQAPKSKPVLREAAAKPVKVVASGGAGGDWSEF